MTTRLSLTIDDVLDDKLLRDQFAAYLKRSFNDDCLKFLLDCREYKGFSTEKRRHSANDILDKYIKLSSPNEINISGPLRNEIIGIVQKLDNQEPKESLFDDVCYFVKRELRDDAFARYIRSCDFEQTVLKRNESFKKKFESKKKETILNITKQEFDQKSITDKDVELMLRLSEDSHVWDALRKTKLNEKENSAYTYISSPIKTCDGGKVMLVKYVGLVPYSAERTVNEMMSVEGRKKYWLKGQVKDELMEYKEFEEDSNHSISLSLYTYSMMRLLKPFECVKMNTVVYDTKRRCYMYVMKSTNAYGRHKDMKRSTPMTYFYSVQVNQVAEDKCRYNIVLLYFMNKTDNYFVLKMAVSHAPYDVQNGIIAMMNDAEKKGYPAVNDNKVSDTLKHFMTKTNGGRTWDTSGVNL